MKTNLVRLFALSAIVAAAAWGQQIDVARAHAKRGGWAAPVVGVWNVAVTVTNCQTGAPIRNVHTVQMFQADGAFTETTSSGSRGSSIGFWYLEEGQTYGVNYLFFRYNPDETLASMAKAANVITLSADGATFTVTATINDFDANDKLISTGCVTQTAKRL